ncbi:hypothetical protein [Micromonospora sp. NPDC005806]|uniref:hypothetical protein n=1 Tax=Micromonospora sp. NPDC005806 TaxID=3364234 RepID=UPI003675DD9D
MLDEETREDHALIGPREAGDAVGDLGDHCRLGDYPEPDAAHLARFAEDVAGEGVKGVLAEALGGRSGGGVRVPHLGDLVSAGGQLTEETARDGLSLGGLGLALCDLTGGGVDLRG